MKRYNLEICTDITGHASLREVECPDGQWIKASDLEIELLKPSPLTKEELDFIKSEQSEL